MSRPMTKDVPAACQCPRCKVHAAGLGAGPYTPAQYALIAPLATTGPTDDPVDSDPAVRAASERLAEVRAVFDAAAAAWESAVAEHRSAQLRSGDEFIRNADGDPVGYRGKSTLVPGLSQLKEAERDAKEQREVTWAAVVKAQDAVRRAQHAARLAAVQASRR